jgi:AcrR family transcriptional regulator
MRRPKRLKLASKQGSRQNALSAEDWVSTGAELLAEHNVNGIEIPDLCKRLGVTKGSFYWHFEGRGDLLSAILEDWRRRMTLDVTVRASRAGSSVATTLRYLLGLVRRPRPNRNAAIEKSIRDWSRIDERAHTAVVEVDQIRLAYFRELFRRHNFSEKEASLRAYAAYTIMMGDSMLRETIELDHPADDYIEKFVELLLAGAKDSAAKARLNKISDRHKNAVAE